MEAVLRLKLIERIRPDDRVLLLSASDHNLVRALMSIAQHVTVYDVDYASLRSLKREAGAPRNLLVVDNPLVQPEAIYSKAIILSPKGREFARAQLWNAYQGLAETGELYVIGANEEGVRSVIADSGRLFTSVRTLAYKGRQRLGAAQKRSNYTAYPEEWGELPTRVQQRRLQTSVGDVMVGTLPGVFSWQALDAGTAFLLNQNMVREYAVNADILDVGCGTGVIGGALGQWARTVHMTDVNLLAVECARMTAQLNRLSDAHVYPSDVYADVPDTRFDLIISNPPFHKGFDVSKDTAAQIIIGAAECLKPSGRLVLVANAFLPYERLMEPCFAQVRTLAQDNRYKVLAGTA